MRSASVPRPFSAGSCRVPATATGTGASAGASSTHPEAVARSTTPAIGGRLRRFSSNGTDSACWDASGRSPDCRSRASGQASPVSRCSGRPRPASASGQRPGSASGKRPASASSTRKSPLSAAEARLLAKITFDSTERKKAYLEDGEFPLAPFFKNLAGPVLEYVAAGDDEDPQPRLVERSSLSAALNVWVPDTVVWQGGQRPVWYYTSNDGSLRAARGFSLWDVQRRFEKKNKPREVVAVLKTPKFDGVSSHIRILTSRQLADVLPSIERNAAETPAVLQRFVRGGERPCLFRCRWKKGLHALELHAILLKRADSAEPGAAACGPRERVGSEQAARAQHRLSSAEERLLLVTAHRPEILELQAVTGAVRNELASTMNHIASHLLRCRGMDLQDLVCDFIQDHTKRLWFIQVKAFQRVPLPKPLPQGVHTAAALRAGWQGEVHGLRDAGRCGVCECTVALEQLQKVVSGRQIMLMLERLRRWRSSLSWPVLGDIASKVGWTSADISAESRSEGGELDPRAATWPLVDATANATYQICSTCYELHMELEGLAAAVAELSSYVCPTQATELHHHASGGDESHAERAGGVNEEYLDSKTAEDSESQESRRTMNAFVARLLTPPRPTKSPAGSSGRSSGKEFPLFESPCKTGRLTPSMPSLWECPLEPATTMVVMHSGRPAMLLRYRLLFFAQALFGGSDWLQQKAKEHGLLALTWSLLGTKRCVALRQAQSGAAAMEAASAELRVNALGSTYFFARDSGAPGIWVHGHPTLHVYIVAAKSGQRLAYTSFDLRRVVEGTVELHQFDGAMRGACEDSCFPPRLRAALGLVGGSAFDCAGRQDLRSHVPDLIYVPPAQEAVAEPLPEVWLALISGVVTQQSVL